MAEAEGNVSLVVQEGEGGGGVKVIEGEGGETKAIWGGDCCVLQFLRLPPSFDLCFVFSIMSLPWDISRQRR